MPSYAPGTLFIIPDWREKYTTGTNANLLILMPRNDCADVLAPCPGCQLAACGITVLELMVFRNEKRLLGFKCFFFSCIGFTGCLPLSKGKNGKKNIEGQGRLHTGIVPGECSQVAYPAHDWISDE